MTRELPVLPASCSLDAAGVAAQGERYRRAGEGAVVLARTARELRVRLGPAADDRLVADIVATERECCPFFGLAYDRDERELSVTVSRAADEPALDAIAFALGVAEGRATTSPSTAAPASSRSGAW